MACPAETMPPGRADIRRKAGSPAPSDVTVQKTRITSSGRTAAAGMVPGAWIVVQVFQTQQSWRVPQVGPDGSPATPLQGSGGVVRCATGGAGRNRRARKRRRALARHDGVRRALVEHASFWKGVHAVRGDLSGRTGPLWRHFDGVRHTCIHCTGGDVEKVALRYRHVLGGCNSGNEFAAAGSARERAACPRRFA